MVETTQATTKEVVDQSEESKVIDESAAVKTMTKNQYRNMKRKAKKQRDKEAKANMKPEERLALELEAKLTMKPKAEHESF